MTDNSHLHYAVEMVRNNIEAYLHELQQALPYVPPIPVEALYSLHIAQDYEGMVQLIKNTMNIDVCLRVGWVNSGGRDAPAWIELPPNMPFYGSSAFREMTITMFIRRSFLEQSTYDQAAIVVAHELSHIVLDSIGHPLRREEKAVDLTAMLLGFCALYASGCYREETSQNGTSIRTLGYLSQEEVELANQILAQRQSSTKTKAALLSRALRGIRARIMRPFLGVLGLALLVVVAWIVSRPAPSTPDSAASPPIVSAPVPKARFINSDFAALKAKYGHPDEEDSTAYDNPRPPLVTRWITYNKQRLRFMFLADGKVGDPPPYSRWIFLGAIDDISKEPLKAEEIEQRFARGEAPVPLPVPRPKAPATPFEQANIAINNDDEEDALKILRPLAERGDPKAQFMVGELYYLSKKQNPEALKWFRLAVGQRHAGAMYFLGNMHHNGHAVPQNFVEAYKWYSLAASRAGPREKGEMDTVTMATENRDGVARKMTTAQVAEAQRLAKDWKPAPKRQTSPGGPTNLTPK